jgi:succinate dehydrogenase/fumarate reductase flavoprotein subunit
MIRGYISLIEKKEPLIPEHFEIYNMLQLAEVITENALFREESRGAHFRSDFTSPDDKQKKSIIREIGKEVRYDTEPHVY